MSARRLVLATGNPDKVREIGALLAGSGLELVAVTELVPGWAVDETGRTIEENARLKVRAAAAVTGLAAAADDTGLFVDALGGEPGVRSSRFAGPDASYHDNVARLLERMRAVPPEARGGRFRTVVALARPDGELREFEGALEGRIAARPRGRGGFGYDPVFVPRGGSRTLAEMSLEEKNRLSHRARAFAAAERFLVERPAWLARAG